MQMTTNSKKICIAAVIVLLLQRKTERQGAESEQGAENKKISRSEHPHSLHIFPGNLVALPSLTGRENAVHILPPRRKESGGNNPVAFPTHIANISKHSCHSSQFSFVLVSTGLFDTTTTHNMFFFPSRRGAGQTNKPKRKTELREDPFFPSICHK